MTASFDARLEPRHSAPKEEREVPALSGAQILELHNAGRFRDVIARLLAQARDPEINRVRGDLLRRAAELMPGSQTSKVREIHNTLTKFAALPSLPRPLDAGMVEGLLCTVLLIDGGRACSESTVLRALRPRPLSAVGGV